MRNTVASEWVKVWSVRSTWWCLAATMVSMVLTALTLGGSAVTEQREVVEASGPVVSATSFVQFALVALAMLVITSEYSSGSIRSTLQATPLRGRVLAAKALVVAPVLFVVGVVSGAVATAVNYVVLSTEVFGGLVRLEPGALVHDLVTTGVFFALVGVMTVGAGAALRGSAGTLTVVFMMLMGLPLLLAMTGVPVALEISMRLPMFAGLAFMGSADNLTGGPIPYSAGEGLAWLVGWAGVALVAGLAVLRRRDA
ncbi:ABC transporter permease [Nonomuraea sp. NPDC050663]|uniref:ABC transporter permease n=1 Tax=Nonomuraea sp. NPDC050663 TaxID=3364370 RepID=UPI0037AEEBE3